MQIHAKVAVVATVALALTLAAFGAGVAHAQAKAKPQRTQGNFMAFDAATNTIKLKEKGKETVYTVKPEGTILTRTAVKINGHGAKITDLPPNAPIIVYWIPDEKDPKMKFARTIDAPNVPEDLREEFENN